MIVPRYVRPIDVLWVVLLPALFLFLAPIQRFMPAGWVDPAVYLGLSMDYYDTVKRLGWNYQALRVSFIVPMAAATHFLAPLTAHYVVMAGFYLGGLVSLYLGASILWGRPAAAIAVATLAYSPVYLIANTAGYVDGAFVAYTLALFASMALWATTLNAFWLVPAGGFLILAVLAHTLAAAPAGIIMLFFLVYRWQAAISRPFRNIAAGVLGVAIVWIAFLWVLSPFNFGIQAFHSMTWIVNASISGIGTNYRVNVMDWLPSTTRIVPGIINAVVLLILFLRTEPEQPSRIAAVAAAVLAVLTLALLPVYDVVVGGSATQAAFYAGLVLPGLAIGSAALASRLLPQNTASSTLIVAVVTFVLAGMTWFAVPVSDWMARSGLLPDLLVLTLVALALAAILLTPFAGRPVVRTGVLLAMLMLTALSMTVNKDTRPLYKTEKTVDHAEYFDGAVYLRSLIESETIDGRTPLFWYDRASFAARDGRSEELARPLRFGNQQLLLTYYDTLSSLRLWDRSLFMTDLKPRQTIKRTPQIERDDVTMVILDQDPKSTQAAIAALGKAGLRCDIRQSATYLSRSFDLRITLVDLLGPAGFGQAVCGR